MGIYSVMLIALLMISFPANVVGSERSALMAARYEMRSLLITSNLPFSKWNSIFKDEMTTNAAIDRLVHHAVILELNTSSYRSECAKRNKVEAINVD